MGRAGLNQCLCEYCANCDLKIKVINTIVDAHARIRHVYHAVAVSVCENSGKMCAYRQCGDCGIDKLQEYLSSLQNRTGEVSWHRWTSKKIKSGVKEVMRKVLETRKGTSSEMLQEFLEEIRFLSEHLYRAKWQHQEFEKLRLARPFPSDLLLTVMDYAENFTCLFQHEVQSAHWFHEQVTLHPIAAYYRCSNPECDEAVYESLIFVSNDLHHDYHAVHLFELRALEHLQKVRHLNMRQIIHWSDGASSQYKSKGRFADIAASNIDFPDLQVHQNYFGSRHGKGPCDGEAAVVKSHTTIAVKSAEVIISNAQDFYNYCSQSNLNKQPLENGVCSHFLRTFFWVQQGEVQRNRPQRQVKTVKGTRMFHQVKCGGTGGTIITRHLTCLCQACLSGVGMCPSVDIVGPWAEHSLIPQEPHPVLINLPYPNGQLSAEPQQLPQPFQPAQLQNDSLQQPDQSPIHPHQSAQLDCSIVESEDSMIELARPASQPGNIQKEWKINTCIVVQYPEGRFPGVVVNDKPELRVKFLRPHKTKKHVFVYPEVEDVQTISANMIVSNSVVDLLPVSSSFREWKVEGFNF